MSSRYSGRDNLDLMSLATNYNQAVFEWLSNDISQGCSILEFGAGRGEFCNRFDGYNISAVELDEGMHDTIVCKTYRYLSELDRTFDIIFAVNVLEHIWDDCGIINDFSRLLNHGGKVKIFVPARKELFSSMDELVGHKRRYSMTDLFNLLSTNGFHIVMCRYFDCIGYFASLLFKLLRKNSAFNIETIIAYDRLVFPVSCFLDKITCGRIIGKNIVLEAMKPCSENPSDRSLV